MLAVRRLRASESADSRAVCRLSSRSRDARFGLRGRGGVQRGLGSIQRAAPAFGVGLRLRQLGFDFGEAAALGEAARGAGRRMRRGSESVPTPQIALGRHQALARLERARRDGCRCPCRRRRSARGGVRVQPVPGRALQGRRRPPAAQGRFRAVATSVQRIGADGSTGASRSSPNAAPSAFSKPFSTEMWSITGGHRLRVSTARTFDSVFASVSSRCVRRSASLSAVLAASSCSRAAACAASAATAAASASLNAACGALGVG